MVKKVLIEQGELERMQQRQLREYTPEMHSLANIHTEMRKVFDNKKLTPTQKLTLLATYTSRFDKLKKETGALSGAAHSSLAVPATPIAKTEPVKKDEQEHVEAEEQKHEVDQEEEEAVAEPKDDDEKEEESPLLAVRRMGIKGIYAEKAERLYDKILAHPKVLTRNEQGELVLNGEPQPGTSFDKLFTSMVSQARDLNQTGMKRFLGALRQIGVRADELSGKNLRSLYLEPVTNTKSTRKRLHELRQSEAHAVAPTSKAGSSQEGNGPPGRRPNVLYVYS